MDMGKFQWPQRLLSKTYMSKSNNFLFIKNYITGEKFTYKLHDLWKYGL